MSNVKHLDLFSGIGGFALAARWAGLQTIGFVEIDDYCRRVLAKQFPDVPLLAKDIHDFDATTMRGSVDVVTGGFPCQPFSVAGLRRGAEDDRAIWPQMLRVVTECRPGWVVGENVVGLIDLALDDVLASLEGEGYEARTVVFPACAVGAWHIRQRVFIVAHANCDRQRNRQIQYQHRLGQSPSNAGNDGTAWIVADAAGERQPRQGESVERRCAAPLREGQAVDAVSGGLNDIWQAEPDVGRVVDGLSRKLDIRPRLKALGNAVVPQQVYPILAAIAAMETA